MSKRGKKFLIKILIFKSKR